MYLYFEALGGLNDMLSNIQIAIQYCKKTNRTLLLHGMKTYYNINLSDYLILNHKNVIYDSNIILDIINQPRTIYPYELHDKIIDIFNNKIIFEYVDNKNFTYNNKSLDFPSVDINANLVIVARCGGGNGYELFRNLKFKPVILDECNRRYNLLKKPYLGIQIRNTDYKCDYQKFYKENISLFDNIFIATDDIQALNFYKATGLSIHNFTTFPDNHYHSLHSSTINSDIKFIDVICDIYIMALSEKILSNSQGGFIKLVSDCFNNKDKIIEQFK
jgi:hypothetical protein